jgi:hypothetical protein
MDVLQGASNYSPLVRIEPNPEVISNTHAGVDITNGYQQSVKRHLTLTDDESVTVRNKMNNGTFGR